jgi:hypothetical protein
MWEIFKKKKGKDFYRDSIAFFAYDPDNYIDILTKYQYHLSTKTII